MVIGIGIDAVDVARISQALGRHPGRFAEKIFTPEERGYCEAQPEAAQHFAARYAAKEATLKVLGTGWARGLAFREIEVLRDSSGKPSLRLTGRAERRARELGIVRLHLSLTHTKALAFAEVLAEGAS